MRMLSVKLLNDCLYDSEGDDPLQDWDSVEKWHISLPQERMLLAPITCDFSDSAVEILEVLDTMMANISINRPRATRKWVVEMSEIWPCISGLCADHLQNSESKLLPTRSCLNAKTAMPRWQRTLWSRSSVIGLQADKKTAGLEVVPLDTLLSQTQESLKRALEPHACMRLQGALKRRPQVLASIRVPWMLPLM